MTKTHVPAATIQASTGAYAVHVRSGLAADLADLLHETVRAHHYAILSDTTVAGLHGATVLEQLRSAGLRSDLLSFPAGEAHKKRETWAALTDEMLTLGIGRDGCVIALGGGVVGDLAGFVAATYMRGLRLVLVPTTLLAMIDASIGGKTGVDVPAGKNLVGAFHAPRVVATDPDYLATLPESTFREGMAEAVKHGAIADAAYLAWLADNAPAILRRDPDALLRLIQRSVEIKAEFVNRDEREAGPRAALNFGHTIGHSIERLSAYAIPHGHAVSIGMVAEARMGEVDGMTARGTASRLEAALQAFGLPTRLPPEYSAEAISHAAGSDKKTRADTVRYSLVSEPGRIARRGGEWTTPVSGSAFRHVCGADSLPL